LTSFLILKIAEDLILLRADLAAPEFDEESDLGALQSVVRKQPFMMETIMSILALISHFKKDDLPLCTYFVSGNKSFTSSTRTRDSAML
jgi:hypothetical protein